MSEERRKRQQGREQQGEPNPAVRKVIVIALIAAIAAAVIFFLRHQHTSRLDGFARCLGTKAAKMYGAYWCPHCDEQKEMFGSSFRYAPYIECGIKGSQKLAQVCVDASIKHFPTWVFADGARVEGSHSLEFLSQETGCPLP
jgi:phage baseplate assembly protein gpV